MSETQGEQMSEPEVTGVQSSERFEIDPSLIDHIDGHQHRFSRDAQQDAMRLASMEHEGQFHDILVRRSDKVGRFELIDGEGRLADAKTLKLKTIGARIVQVNDGEAAILSLQANDLRQGVNPMEYARGLKRAITLGMSLEECLKRLGRLTADGKPDMHFGSEMMKLLDLNPEEQEMVAKGIINKQSALELARIEQHLRTRVLKVAKEIEGEEAPKKAKATKKKAEAEAKKEDSSGGILKLKPSTGSAPKPPEPVHQISTKAVREAKKQIGLKDGPRFIGLRAAKELETKVDETDKLDEEQKKLAKKIIEYLLGRRKTIPF
jgi:ParB-like chromosome segregation protein Spo0J